MTTTTTATTNFSSTVVNLIASKILANLRANHAYMQPGNYRADGHRDGTNNVVTWTTYADLAVATTALTEGVAPTDNALTISVESASASQYGNTVAISDLAALENPHNLIRVASDNLADNAARTIDVLVRDIVTAGASVIYSSGAARSAVPASAVLNGTLVKRMVEELGAGNVRPFPNGNYRMIIHPRQAADLQRDSATAGYVDIFKYSEMASALNAGMLRTASFAGMDFLISSDSKIFATAGVSSANVYGAVAFGQEAYGVYWLQDLQAYLVPAGGDHSDPLAQKAIAGWKVAFASKLLTNPGAQLIRLETGSTNG